MNKHLLTMLFTATLLTPLTSNAQTMDHHTGHMNHTNMSHSSHSMLKMAPNHVMGDHTHKKGMWMLSYNYGRMDMEGIRNGTSSMTHRDVLSTPNVNSGPANLRVIPTDMATNMHMFGLMGGLTNNITATFMAPYLNKKMDHSVYNMMGTNQIGTSRVETSGFGDIQAGVIMPIKKSEKHNLNGLLSLSLPTGSIDEEDVMLMPSGMTSTMRTAYGMQLGTGTYDILPGLTYGYHDGDWSYGAAYKGRVHLGENDEDYTRGDWHELTGWAGYRINQNFGLTAIIKGKTESKIDGQDSNIGGASSGANPAFYGGDKIHLGLNGTWRFHKKNTLKAEFNAPVYQDLNGPQLKSDYSFSLKWQKGF